jgi:hypothetical protein
MYPVAPRELECRRVDEQADADGRGSACEHERSAEGVELWTRSDVVVCLTAGDGAILSFSTASVIRCEYCRLLVKV